MEGHEQVRVEVLVFEGCPHAEAAILLARAVAERLGPGIRVERVDVDTPERAAEVAFPGSPSIRVNGADVEGRKGAAGRLCCRTYEDGAGLPRNGWSKPPFCGQWHHGACCFSAWRTRPAANWLRVSRDRSPRLA